MEKCGLLHLFSRWSRHLPAHMIEAFRDARLHAGDGCEKGRDFVESRCRGSVLLDWSSSVPSFCRALGTPGVQAFAEMSPAGHRTETNGFVSVLQNWRDLLDNVDVSDCD